jgi:hypothetical protein
MGPSDLTGALFWVAVRKGADSAELPKEPEREPISNEVQVAKKQPSWLQLSFDVWRAGLEAQQVIGLRLAKLVGGGAPAAAEMQRMVAEKMDAALEAQQAAAESMLLGKPAEIPSRTLALYRRKMRANGRRLAAKGQVSSPRRRLKKDPRK